MPKLYLITHSMSDHLPTDSDGERSVVYVPSTQEDIGQCLDAVRSTDTVYFYISTRTPWSASELLPCFHFGWKHPRVMVVTCGCQGSHIPEGFHTQYIPCGSCPKHFKHLAKIYLEGVDI